MVPFRHASQTISIRAGHPLFLSSFLWWLCVCFCTGCMQKQLGSQTWQGLGRCSKFRHGSAVSLGQAPTARQGGDRGHSATQVLRQPQEHLQEVNHVLFVVAMISGCLLLFVLFSFSKGIQKARFYHTRGWQDVTQERWKAVPLSKGYVFTNPCLSERARLIKVLCSFAGCLE